MKNRLMRSACMVAVMAVLCAHAAADTHVLPGVVPHIGFKKLVAGAAIAGGAAYCKDRAQHADKDLMWVELEDAGVDLDTLTPSCLQMLTYKKAKSSSDKLRAELNEERASSGMPPDPNDCHAHHIVPENENRKWAQEFAIRARKAIDGCVGINSAENGIYLPGNTRIQNRGSAQCEGSVHSKIHNKRYYSAVSDRLRDAREAGGCAEVRNELKSIKNDIFRGIL